MVANLRVGLGALEFKPEKAAWIFNDSFLAMDSYNGSRNGVFWLIQVGYNLGRDLLWKKY